MESIHELHLELIDVFKNDGFNGYEIVFSVQGQRFCFLTGNTKHPFPLNVKHQFAEKDICRLCGKNIYAAPIGHQLCAYFQRNMRELLQYFLTTHKDRF
ncbi:hypothetical protein JOC77_001551 [Peribacillus deserti]|uniref:Transcriptional regulator n=1 Tax=Peribacillus deserti TaxID=673318 RepID=A0ABS2QG43_9BACI|nr:hypothetical protein [Peribacillus deserti]MBM7692124.1 hypothetical protein [Peribacillus deserti]